MTYKYRNLVKVSQSRKKLVEQYKGYRIPNKLTCLILDKFYCICFLSEMTS